MAEKAALCLPLCTQTVAGFAVLLGILVFFMNQERRGRSVLVRLHINDRCALLAAGRRRRGVKIKSYDA